MPSSVCSLSISMTLPSFANSPPSLSSGKYSAIQNFLVTSYNASRLLEVVSSGPKTRNEFMFSFITSRRKTPSGRVFSASTVTGLVELDPIVAEVRQAQSLL